MNETMRLVKVVGMFTGRFADKDVVFKGKHWLCPE